MDSMDYLPMLSPRTLSLRMKNRALLTALEKSDELERVQVSNEGERGMFCIPSISNDFKEIDVVTLCGKSQCVQNDEMSQQTFLNRYNQENHSPLGSFYDIKTVTDEIMEDMKQGTSFTANSPIKKNCIEKTPNITARRFRWSLSHEQQRAAEAQMHAPTHSHSTSKCYCTDLSTVRAQPDSRYIIQLHGRKQHIPSRLKKQRYRSDSISRHSRMVRWADQFENSSSPSKVASDIPMCKVEDPFESDKYPAECPPTCVTGISSSESHSSVLERVKNFRESHWYECHASPREGSIASDHECVQHYVLNRRLFLEPLYKDDSGQGTCPVCRLSSDHATEQLQCSRMNPDHGNSKGQPLRCWSGHVMVTLPKAVLEPDPICYKPMEALSKNEKHGKPKPKSCFLVSHHRSLAGKGSILHPCDSLALRFQKRM